jgi:hypothetical protein
MRRFTLVQEIATDVDNHWRLFFDDDFERAMYLDGFRFPRYELLESRKSDNEIVRRIKVTPRLDVPAAVAKLLGSSFGYIEEARFDAKARVLRARLIPNVLADRLSSEVTVRAEPAGEGRCRRTVDGTVDARIFGVGGLVEGALEKNLRSGWAQAAAYMNRKVVAS